MAEAHRQLLAGVREVAFARSLPMATRDLRMGRSRLGDRAGVIGAAIMVADHLLAPGRSTARCSVRAELRDVRGFGLPAFDPVAEARRNWRDHWGDDPVPSMSAVTSIMRVQQILLARLNDELKAFDLTFPRYEALMLLYYSRRGALPLGKMGDRLQVHRTSVTNIIDGLERSGFVRREPHERDRRTTLAAITPARPRDRGGRDRGAERPEVGHDRRGRGPRGHHRPQPRLRSPSARARR